MRKLTLSTAETIISAAFEKAGELNLKPLTVAVLDAGGHAILLKRQDGALPQPATRAPVGKAAVSKQVADERLFPGYKAASLPHEGGRFGLA